MSELFIALNLIIFQHKTQVLPCFKRPYLTGPVTFNVCNCNLLPSTTLISLLLLKHFRHTPASGPLHLLVVPAWNILPQDHLLHFAQMPPLHRDIS
jgi:hypothetical protein